MTQSLRISRKKDFVFSVLCIILSALMLAYGKSLRYGTTRGIDISLNVVIPTLFPFFVLSDIWATYFKVRNDSQICSLFQKVFAIPGIGITAFLSGCICGFPIGVKTATHLYKEEIINKEQLTVLCGFSNNPSAAFIISGVGLGIFGSLKTGIELFLLTVLSSLICGFIFRPQKVDISKGHHITGQNINLVESVKNAGINSIIVSSYIIFFSSVISLLSSIVDFPSFEAIASALLEIGCAVNVISKNASFSYLIKLCLVAFSLGFSGLSVHMQAFSFMPVEISRHKYLLIKFMQGIICFIVSVVYFSIT